MMMMMMVFQSVKVEILLSSCATHARLQNVSVCSHECWSTHTSQHARWTGAGNFTQASNFYIHREKSKEIRKDAIRFYLSPLTIL